MGAAYCAAEADFTCFRRRTASGYLLRGRDRVALGQASLPNLGARESLTDIKGMRDGNKTELPIMVVILIFVTTVGNVAAQSQSETRCPSVSVSLIESPRPEQDPWSFVATVGNVSPDLKLSYEWTARNGQVVSGQGTPQVKVLGNRVRKIFNRDGRIVEELQLESFTATVAVRGAPSDCDKPRASMSFIGGPPPPPVTKADEFGPLSFRNLKLKLDNFAQMFRMQPGSVGYIISEGKWPLQKRAIEYLVEKQGLDSERLKYVEKEKARDLKVKLYLIPPGASPPN